MEVLVEMEVMEGESEGHGEDTCGNSGVGS